MKARTGNITLTNDYFKRYEMKFTRELNFERYQ